MFFLPNDNAAIAIYGYKGGAAPEEPQKKNLRQFVVVPFRAKHVQYRMRD